MDRVLLPLIAGLGCTPAGAGAVYWTGVEFSICLFRGQLPATNLNLPQLPGRRVRAGHG